MSADYRFYLLEGDHIVAAKACDCTHDADALLEADEFLKASICPAVEVWNGSRCVAILSKPATAS